MASTAISAQGSTFEIGDGGGPEVFTEVGNTLSFDGFDGESSDIDVTNLSSSAKEYRVGLQDFGNFTLNVHPDIDDAGQAAMRAAKASAAVTNFKLTLPNGKVGSFSGLVKSAPMSGGVDAVVTGSFRIRVTGAVVWA